MEKNSTIKLVDQIIEAQEEVIKFILDYVKHSAGRKPVRKRPLEKALREKFDFWLIQCCLCRRWLPPNQFYYKRARSNRYSWCKSCCQTQRVYGKKQDIPPGIIESHPPRYVPKHKYKLKNKNEHGPKKRFNKTEVTIQGNGRSQEKGAEKGGKAE